MGRLKAPAVYAVIFSAMLVISSVSGYFLGKSGAERNAEIYINDLCGRFGAAMQTVSDEHMRETAAYAYTGTYSEADIALGEQYLSQYGYSTKKNIATAQFTVSADNTAAASAAASAAVFISAGLFTLWILSDVSREIKKLCTDAECICCGRIYHEDSSLYGAVRQCSNSFSRLSEYTQMLEGRLEKESRYIHQLISDISHQMKTPVAALRINTEIMLGEPDMPRDTREDFLNRCTSQLDRLEWLIAGLLKSARLDSGVIEFDMKPHKLKSAADDAVSVYISDADKKGIELINCVPDEIIMNMDIRWLSEAIGNIVKNAVEHTPDGGKIMISGSETPLTAEISVSDSGSGISPELMPRIFDRFCTGAKGGTSVKNVGIGLAISKSIISRHDGNIRVTSSGNGTTFTITFLKTRC